MRPAISDKLPWDATVVRQERQNSQLYVAKGLSDQVMSLQAWLSGRLESHGLLVRLRQDGEVRDVRKATDMSLSVTLHTISLGCLGGAPT